MLSRRQLLKYGGLAGGGLVLSRGGWTTRAWAATAAPGLADPALQPKFAYAVPNALDPSFLYTPRGGKITVGVSPSVQNTGLVDPGTGNLLPTPVWGYGDRRGPTWPGRTFQVRSGEPLQVTWENNLFGAPFLIRAKDNSSIPDGNGGYYGNYDGRSVVDTSLHWAYGLQGYTQYSIPNDGVPIVVHVHGGHSDFQYDGNPEFFFSPGWVVRGPQWRSKYFQYFNDQPAGTIWYHDHALGITRLNVYAGMAGFYIIRDEFDTGLPVNARKNGNTLDLPAFPYEAAFAIQDKMFKATGELFYPSFPGDPFYDDFITGEGANLPSTTFIGGGPTALAEFFGDHIVVNGVIWPKMDVEPRNYRLRFLNGCDSRFLVVQFFEVPANATDFSAAIQQLEFTVIGSDQGLASSTSTIDTLVMETGSRYDVILDFAQVSQGNRVIMKNIGGDAPFGGDYGDDLAADDFFDDRQTDRIMAFDVVLPLDPGVPDVAPDDSTINFGPNVPGQVNRTRKVALFEGNDEFGRLQPLLGTAEPATDYLGNPIYWPTSQPYVAAGLAGEQMEGAIAWHSPTTENPKLGDTEIWEIYNATGDAHPIHLHLVHFEILDRQDFNADVVEQPVVQHNGDLGVGFRLENIQKVGAIYPAGTDAEYVENAPKDMVTALPGQVTRIKATFDKPGRYVWHCHILSHEDHEMMRVLHVGPGA